MVSLYAVREGEDRGSFIMDHVPVVPCPTGDVIHAIERGLNRLVDEALKRALWREQSVYLHAHGFDGYQPTLLNQSRSCRGFNAQEPGRRPAHLDPLS